MRLLFLFAALLPAALSAAPAAAEPTLLEVDQRLAAIAWRLTTANASLCRDQQPVIGAALHAADQYPPALRAAFAAPVAVELVVPGAPAATAGVVADDGLVAVDGAAVPAPAGSGDPTSVTRDTAQALIAAHPPTAPLALTLRRAGADRTVTVQPRAGCRVEFEVLAGNKLGASSDGRVVQVGGRLFALFGDDQVAVVVAHELAHAVLRHRARLEAAGVRWGLLAELGRNGRLFRATETEADLLGAYLLRNAGWDPQLAVRFWREEGGKIDGGFFRSRTHPSAKARADAIAAELATMPADAPLPYAPPLLARRDAPLG
ncbi:peptidase M48 family protein [Sphingomonas sp. RHCKR7]|uniref:M48 family metallopeptidase n=1 Tax=Sphingomonas folli TaxID=2862497 RepID=UPI001CA4AFA5|nr:M48 family metallopeptidase [Sphingomonas folli]MBW6527778.1 peptidase M48 family protein [Sphingomonas folli]